MEVQRKAQLVPQINTPFFHSEGQPQVYSPNTVLKAAWSRDFPTGTLFLLGIYGQ